MTHREFTSFDENTAPAPAREALAKTKRAFGAIPAPLARYASSPLMLGAALGGLDTFEKSSLAPLEREVLAMTVGRVNGCRLCLELHGRLLASMKAPEEVTSALRAGTALSDRRLEALRQFVLASQAEQGNVPPRVWSDFRAAGFSHEHALDVLLGISVYTLTTFANRLTETSE